MNEPLQIVHSSEGGGALPPLKAAIFAEFIEFYAMPDPDKAKAFNIPFDKEKGRYERIPTMQDFALKHGVHRNTLGAWKQRPEFVAAVDLKQREWGLDLVGNVMAALYRRCVRYGFAADVELFLAYYKNWDRKQVIKHVTEKFSMDDIRALLAPLPVADQERFYALITDIVTQSGIQRGHAEVQRDQPLLTAGHQE